MSIPSYLKNNFYIESNRDFSSDYSNIDSKEIDMTLSGRYLGTYPDISIDMKELDKYPSHIYIKTLSNKIKKLYNINDKEVILGSGSNGILQNMIKILFKNGGNLVTPFLTFDQAEFAVTSFGCVTKRCFMNNYDISLFNIESSIDENTKLVYLCNPNNPTGLLIANESLIELAMNYSNVYFIIDESNLEFSKQKSLLEFEFPNNILILKSFSKAYGLANLRIGYAICSKQFYDLYRKMVTVNEFSGISCAIALKCVDKQNYLSNVENVIKQREFLKKELEKMNIEILETNSNTLFTKRTFNIEEYQKLIDNNISVVKVIDQNSMIHYRIAVQDELTNKLFIDRMKKIYK